MLVFDDLDGEEAEHTVRIGWGDLLFELHLSAANYAIMDAVFQILHSKGRDVANPKSAPKQPEELRQIGVSAPEQNPHLHPEVADAIMGLLRGVPADSLLQLQQAARVLTEPEVVDHAEPEAEPEPEAEAEEIEPEVEEPATGDEAEEDTEAGEPAEEIEPDADEEDTGTHSGEGQLRLGADVEPEKPAAPRLVKIPPNLIAADLTKPQREAIREWANTVWCHTDGGREVRKVGRFPQAALDAYRVAYAAQAAASNP